MRETPLREPLDSLTPGRGCTYVATADAESAVVYCCDQTVTLDRRWSCDDCGVCGRVFRLDKKRGVVVTAPYRGPTTREGELGTAELLREAFVDVLSRLWDEAQTGRRMAAGLRWMAKRLEAW